MNDAKYSTSRGVEQAIREAARRAHREGPTVLVQERVQQEVFRRLLSRVFSESDASWVLKGGTGLLARVPDARATHDIDLHRSGHSIEHSLDELCRLAEKDLGDHFHFSYRSHRPILVGDQLRDFEGIAVAFDVYLGVKGYGTVSIDLVDLVVFATTQEIDADGLSRALHVQLGTLDESQLSDSRKLSVPMRWGSAYENMARTVPACNDYQNIESAKQLMVRFIDPVLSGDVIGKTWDPVTLAWQK